MAVDAVLVALEAVGRGDGARIVKIAQRRGVPLFLLVGTVSSTMADIDNKAWRRAESDRLLSAASAVFALGEPANEWVLGRAANLHPLASSDPRIFGRIVAGEIEEFGGRAIRRAEQAFAQTTAM